MIVLKIQTIAFSFPFSFPFPFTRRKFSIHKYLHWSCCFNYMQYPIGTWLFGEWPVDGVTMSSNSRQWTNLNFVSICAIANTTNTLHTYMFPLTNTCTHTQHTRTHYILRSCVRIRWKLFKFLCTKFSFIAKICNFHGKFLGRERTRKLDGTRKLVSGEKKRAHEREKTDNRSIRAQHKRSKSISPCTDIYMYIYTQIRIEREHRYMKFHWKKCAL